MKRIAVVRAKRTTNRFAEPHGLFEHRVEHRREVAGRGVDDLQHLGGRGLLLQRLARLGQQPCILHRDHRLRGKILQVYLARQRWCARKVLPLFR